VLKCWEQGKYVHSDQGGFSGAVRGDESLLVRNPWSCEWRDVDAMGRRSTCEPGRASLGLLMTVGRLSCPKGKQFLFGGHAGYYCGIAFADSLL
jgi:hypothetical protein